jgi:hypothetical protein
MLISEIYSTPIAPFHNLAGASKKGTRKYLPWSVLYHVEQFDKWFPLDAAYHLEFPIQIIRNASSIILNYFLRFSDPVIWSCGKAKVCVTKGAIYSLTGEILLMFVVEPKIVGGKIVKSHDYDFKKQEDLKRVHILVSNTLMDDPKYLHVHKKLWKILISPHIQKGIEAHYMNPSQLKENTLEEIVAVKRVKHFSSQERYMKEVLPKLLTTGFEDTFVEEDKVHTPVPQRESELYWYENPPEPVVIPPDPGTTFSPPPSPGTVTADWSSVITHRGSSVRVEMVD